MDYVVWLQHYIITSSSKHMTNKSWMRNKDVSGYSAGNIKYLPVFWGCALYDGCLFVIWYKDEGILLLHDLFSVTIKDNKE